MNLRPFFRQTNQKMWGAIVQSVKKTACGHKKRPSCLTFPIKNGKINRRKRRFCVGRIF